MAGVPWIGTRVSWTGREPRKLRGRAVGDQRAPEPEAVAVAVACRSVPSPRVGKLTADGVEHGAKKDTVRQTDVDEEGGVVFVDTGVENLGDDDG